MTNGELSLRMPKEATCDVECAMKVEEIRMLSKKRKQSQRAGGSNGAFAMKGAADGDKVAKRPLHNRNSHETGSHSATGGSSQTLMHHDSNLVGMPPAPPGLSKAAAASGGGSGNSRDSKDSARRRFVWSVPLHQDFVAAVFDVGLKCASPKLLLEMMPVADGLTSEHIKSHLQKYRLHRQRSREEFLKSYNYLTDLDGGKGNGGGSAAATVAKAAAMAGNGPKYSSYGGGGGGRDAEPAGCASSCDCNNISSRSGGGVGGGDSKGCSSGLAAREGCWKAFSEGSGVGPTVGGDVEADRKARGLHAGGGVAGTKDVGEALQQRLQQHGAPAPEEAVNSALLLSHLELLAKGIDLQVKFHNHLRDVVESQQQLQAQLAEQRGKFLLRGDVSDGAGESSHPRIIPSSTTGTDVPPSAVDFPSASSMKHAVGGVSPQEQDEMQKEMRLFVGNGNGNARGGGSGGYLAGCSVVSGPGQAAAAAAAAAAAVAAGDPDWLRASMATAKPGGGSPTATAAADRGGRGSAAEQPGRKGEPTALEQAGSTEYSVDSVRSGLGERQDSNEFRPIFNGATAGDLRDLQQYHRKNHRQHHNQHQHQHQYQQLNPTAVPGDFSNQAGAGGGGSLPKGPLLPSARHTLGEGSRGYVPGDYTLTSKTSETAASSAPPPAAHRQVSFATVLHSAVFAASNPAEARAALAAAGLAPPGGGAQETLTLQRHMQAQMSMQKSMLSACNDQATSLGQREWCAGGGCGVTPAPSGGVEAAGVTDARRGIGSGSNGGGVGGDGAHGAEVGDGRSGGGGGGGGGSDVREGGDGTHAEVGRTEHRLDALPVRAADVGDSSAIIGMGMGLFHQDDLFDFGTLVREGEELKVGDNPTAHASARPAAGDHSEPFTSFMG